MDQNLNKKSTNLKLELLNVVVEAFSTTTSHGLPNIVHTKFISLKIIWAFCYILSMSLCCYLATNHVLEFLNYDVVTKITENYEIPIIFPTITICNRNPFNTEYAMNYINYFKNSTDPLFSKIDPWFLFRANLFNKSDEEKKKFGLKLSETIIYCRFDSLPCNYSNDFVWVYYSHYGNCFRFNSGKKENGDSDNLKKVNRIGKSYGLTLLIYTGEPQHVITDISAGLHIFIHNASENPSNLEGFDVSTATETNFAIRRSFTNNLEHPYTNCKRDLMNAVEDSSLVSHILNSGFKYRFYDCANLCLQQTFIDKIGCNDMSFNQLNQTRTCTTTNDLKLMETTYLEYLSSDLTYLFKSKCPFECETNEFLITTTNGYFPSDHFIKVASPYFKNVSNAAMKEHIKERFLYLNIFYDSFKYINKEVSPKIELISLISNIGGIFGLFLGVSLLSFIEIVDVIFKMISETINFHKRKSKVFLK